jgi:hypothetical protein
MEKELKAAAMRKTGWVPSTQTKHKSKKKGKKK